MKVIERYTIVNGIMYTMRDNKFKISKVTDYHGYNITLKNVKTNKNKRWLIIGYELTEKEIEIQKTTDILNDLIVNSPLLSMWFF